MIKVLAIDDEPLALMQLQTMIERTPYFTLAGACQSAFEAMEIMQQQDIDAIFADINMPDLSGIDFIRTLSNPPIVVFTTAYSQYAIEGYKVNAIDYLLKPFGQSEFQRAASKVKRQYDIIKAAESNRTQNTEETNNTEGHIEGELLFVKSDYRILRINVSEIRYIESQSEYLRIYTVSGQPIMVLMSIKRIAELLPPDRFIRVHRSFIVNMQQIMEISRLRIRMDADTYIPIGDSYKDATLKFINERMIGK